MRTHGIKLSKMEQALLDDSYNDIGIRRMLFIWIDAALAVLVILALLVWDISPQMTTLAFVGYLLVAALEKVSYTRAITAQKALIRRYADRFEDVYRNPEQIEKPQDGIPSPSK